MELVGIRKPQVQGPGPQGFPCDVIMASRERLLQQVILIVQPIRIRKSPK